MTLRPAALTLASVGLAAFAWWLAGRSLPETLSFTFGWLPQTVAVFVALSLAERIGTRFLHSR